MTLVLNDEQTMLRDAARTFLSEQAPVGHLRTLRDSGNKDGISREMWHEFVDMGWSAILVPEAYGGLGYGFTGMGLVLEECGRTLTPSPLLATAMVAAAALTRAGSDEQRKTHLPGIAGGQQLFALAVDEAAQHRPELCRAMAQEAASGYSLTGRKTAVVDGQIADTLIVSARLAASDDIALFLVPADAAGVKRDAMAMLDTHHAADIVFDDVVLPSSALLGEASDGARLLDYLLDVARIGQAAEMLGLAEEVFARTIEYLKDRKQFSVPVGSFQGLQHRAANLYSELDLCRSAVRHALRVLDSGAGDIAEVASLCKAKLCETAHTAAAEGIQMHGGIGMTDECDIGFFLKRCQILETIYGDRYFHIDRFARLKGY